MDAYNGHPVLLVPYPHKQNIFEKQRNERVVILGADKIFAT